MTAIKIAASEQVRLNMTSELPRVFVFRVDAFKARSMGHAIRLLDLFQPLRDEVEVFAGVMEGFDFNFVARL